eukprot:Nitzschia sp. Nitz4//scaffold413_size9536//1760//3250//NITZ4_009094-RA/size9536-augustus-gene-0.18-mRNA-1//-1//CDS//3329551334//7577//frame0
MAKRSKKTVVESESSEEEEVEQGVEEGEEEEESNDENDEEEESSDEEQDNENEVSNLFKGNEDDDDDEEEDDNSDDDGEDDEPAEGSALLAKPTMVGGVEQCTFDLRNMVAMNSHQVPASFLYTRAAKKDADGSITIPMDSGHELEVDEGFLLKKATAGCAQLIATIWQQPMEASDAGPLVTLPGYDEIRLPRALPPPAPKEETRWEKFAKQKGIPLNKEKRSRKVWDETTGTWMFRHGFEKANSSTKEWPIMEVGANDDPFADPWEKIRDAKRARTERNMENRMKNEERAGNIAKGMTNKVLKGREKTRKEGKLGGNADRDNVLPTGVPVDLTSGDGAQSGESTQKLRGKASTVSALEAVQRSTASLGKFDKMREGEPERKKTLSKLKKRKYESGTDTKVVNSESQKSMKILNAVINGGGVAKEKAIRKGQLAKGETAYDYDYNDGLDAANFKKKKGRAGMGKMKKMTKKRTK